MKTSTIIVTIALPMSLVLGCSTGLTSEGYSSRLQEQTMVQEMNLHQPGKIGPMAASRQDNAALRVTLAEHPVLSKESQATTGTVNEMVEGEGLPRPMDYTAGEPEPRNVQPRQRG